MNDDGMAPVRRALFIAFILLILALIFADQIRAVEMPPRYLIITGRYEWQYEQDLPFETLRPMCWNNEVGFCDTAMQGDDMGFVQARVVDLQTGQYGIVVMLPDNECYFWLFQINYGTDGNPHPAIANWISCL